MKMQGRWVAWMAALALAAIMVATPREGAAGPTGPYFFPDPPPGPLFGDPEQPSSRPGRAFRLNVPWLKGTRVDFVWAAGSLRPVVLPRLAIQGGRASTSMGQRNE